MTAIAVACRNVGAGLLKGEQRFFEPKPPQRRTTTLRYAKLSRRGTDSSFNPQR
jgi:hypothetical protein